MSLKFNPVQCTSEQFQLMSANEGYVYFLTDTKKIYLGKGGKMIPMAVSSGIFYGLKNILWDDDGQEKPEEEIFKSYEIEDTGEGLPEKDDLILNTDGCFYRVTDVSGDEFTTKRVTLRGSGGGGGNTPGGGDTPSSGSFSITINKNQYYASADTEMKLAFKGNYSGADNNYISKVEFKLYDPAAADGKKEIDFYSMEKDENGNSLSFNQEYSVYLYQFKEQFKRQQQIRVYMYDLYDNVKSATVTLNIVDLKLTKEKDELLDTTTGVLSYTCGISSDVNKRVITYSIYEQDNLITPIYKQEKDSDGDSTISTNLQLGNLAHGVYVLQVQASASLSGTSKKLMSNILTHKVAVFKADSNEPLLMISLPNILEQYTNLPMHYKVITKESNINYTLDIQVNKKSKVQQSILSNNADVYDLYFEQSGTYTLDVTVMELNLSYSMPITINPYSGRIPVIDINHEYLMLYLNPRDKSNSAIDRDVWADYRGDAVANLDTLTGTLDGFHYGSADGWMKDSQGISYLQLSSGATLNLNQFRPFKTDLSKNLGFTVELDFEVNGVTDYDTALIQCISKSGGNTNVGFIITGDNIVFAGSSAAISLNLVEGKRTRVSFVVERNPNKSDEFPLMYGYLNGKISAAKIYGGATFIDAQNNWATLKVTSNDAQVKIYGIRFYNIALDDRTILNNYTASLPTLAEREKSYASNNMVYSGSDISYDEVIKPNYDLGIPYMVLTGGYATEPESKWQLKDFQNRGDGKLPTGKKDYRLVDVKVVYPDSKKYPFFANYQNYEFINEFAGGKPMKDAYSESPINGGAIMYAQGTSSMEYPVKNLRLRFKKPENWYRVKPELDKVEIICMKADYMESSGSHNTGAANLVDALYEGMKMKTPGQAHFGPQEPNDGKKKIVTAIKGHPCLIFYSPTGENGTYEYIGKYNLNLDKATPEPFGFNHDDSDFGYLTDAEGKVVLDENGEKQNSIHCFEFLDNAVEVCNFMNKYKQYIEDDEGNLVPDPSGGLYSYNETWYNTFIKDAKQVPGWTLGFESRYPEDLKGSGDADSLYPLASWLNNLYNLRYGLNGVTANETEAKNKFLREYWKYLDHDFTLVYYLLTEALLMADNRVKNMMIATWGKEHRYFNTDTKEVSKTAPADMTGWEHHFGYIFYPIFYDMDTMMGLDNTGVYRFNYYDEDDNPNIFNGEEVLWNFVRDSIPTEQKQACYRRMEEALLYVAKDSVTGRDLGILSYFNDNQANMANEAFYNGDAKYKYIEPAIEGYHDDLNDKDIAPGAGPFLYAAQGDRSLMREWFMSNRIKFLQGKYKSRLFQSGDRIEYRQYYPTGDIPDEFKGHEATLEAVKPSGTFNLSSIKTGYAGILLGANGELTSEKFEGEQTKPLIVTNMSLANGTEAYIVGLSNLSDLGDMSNKYIQKFIIASSDVRLKNLTLGNPHKDYYNPYWGTSVSNADGSSDSPRIDVSKAIYLQNFNLQNCSQYQSSLDFSNCKAIETVLLTGSGVKDLKLPVGSIIKELRLPTSVTKIDIESCATLEPNMFSIGGYDYGNDDSINNSSADRINKYQNDYSAITSLRVIDTNIDTYAMACRAKNLDNYCLRGIDWTITAQDTQYCLRENSDNLTAEQIKSYYTYDEEHDTYTIWGKETYPTESNVFLYEKIDMVNSMGKMISIPILDQLQTKRLTEDSSKHAEALTGKITINVPNITANELEIYEKYISVYPNLEIVFDTHMAGVTRAYRVKFYRAAYQEGIDTTNLVPYFTRLTDGTKTLETIIADELFSNPTKSPTADTVYNFSGDWVNVLDANKAVYSQFTTGNENSFDVYKPIADMNLLPKFNAETRTYNIQFYEDDGTIIEDIAAEGTYLVPVLNCVASADVPKTQYRYKSDQGLAADKRWGFKGWISEVDYNVLQTNSNYKPTPQDLTTLQVASNLKLYAYYEIEDVNTTASNSSLFDIAYKTNSINGTFVSGYWISLKPEFTDIIQGKITVPAMIGDNKITILGSFREATKITELYCQSGSEYTHVADSACQNCTGLKAVKLSNSIQVIGNNAFKDNANLTSINLSMCTSLIRIGEQAFDSDRSLAIDTLPPNLEVLGVRAFNGCRNITIHALPDSLTTLDTQCFMGCHKVVLSVFGGGNSQLKTMGFMCCSSIAKNANVTKVIIHAPIELKRNTQESGYDTFQDSYNNNLTIFETYSTFGYPNEADLAYDLFGRAITSCGPIT